LQTRASERFARFSPDGRWIAYESDESGRFEIYVRPFPEVDKGKWQVSSDGGSEAVWARSGELFYRNGDNIMAVSTETTPTFKYGTPRLLFEKALLATLGGYDVTPDGKRFLIIRSRETEQTGAQINVVLNWFEELKQRVPVK
jgi:hypothetical protein